MSSNGLQPVMPDRHPKAKILNGTSVTGHPEIGLVNMGSGFTSSLCTGTVVAPRWVITASHCFDFADTLPATGSGHFRTYDDSENQTGDFTLQKILNFANGANQITNVHETLDCSGSDDITLILLSTPVPASIVPQPGTFATQLPADGSQVTMYGRGCNAPSPDPVILPCQGAGTLRSMNWTFGTHRVGNGNTGNLSWVLSDGTLTDPPSVGKQDYAWNTGPGMMEGDSGGPVTDPATGNIWAVNSATASTYGYSEFGSVEYLRPYLCNRAFAEETHSWCIPGGPLIVPPQGCTDTTLFTDQVVRYVCVEAAATNQNLSKCCDPSSVGKWDWDCVQAGAAWASPQTGIGDVCGRDAWVQGPITAPGPTHNTQYYPRDFSVFVLNDAIAFPDVQGAVAAGGQFTARDFNLSYFDTSETALVAVGNVTVQNGTINGSIFSRTITPFPFSRQTTLSDSVTVSYGAAVPSSPTSPIDFGDAFGKLRNMSQALKRYPTSPSASVTKPNSSELDIVSNEKELNIVSLPASQLSGVGSINLTVPTGSTLIVNVTGNTDVTFQSMQVNSNYGDTLWNFPDTTSLRMQSVQFDGSILAPDADVQFDWGGMIMGTLVAKSASPRLSTGSSFEMHLWTFRWPITVSTPSRTIYKIDCGSSSGVSPFGADNYFNGGTARSETHAVTTTGVTNPAPPGVYQSERYGNTITYTLPNLLPGALYTVRLHFAETWWTASGKRKFNVTINGTIVLSKLDIFATTGAPYTAMVREFPATANSAGQIVIKFTSVTDNATIEGIELIK